jgi:hypothetical protein
MHHLTNDLANLNLSVEEYAGSDQIGMGNGSGLYISDNGSNSISTCRHDFILKQIPLVSNICTNLLSVSKFPYNNSVCFEFHSSNFIIKDCQIKILLH